MNDPNNKRIIEHLNLLFIEKFEKLENKFVQDIEDLENLKLDFCHIYRETNLIIGTLKQEEQHNNSTNSANQEETEITKKDRSKTPVGNIKIHNNQKNPANALTERSRTPIKIENKNKIDERSKTPVFNRNQNNDVKKDDKKKEENLKKESQKKEENKIKIEENKKIRKENVSKDKKIEKKETIKIPIEEMKNDGLDKKNYGKKVTNINNSHAKEQNKDHYLSEKIKDEDFKKLSVNKSTESNKKSIPTGNFNNKNSIKESEELHSNNESMKKTVESIENQPEKNLTTFTNNNQIEEKKENDSNNKRKFSKVNKALFLMISENYLNIKERLTILRNHPNFYQISSLVRSRIIIELESQQSEYINLLSKYDDEEHVQIQINKQFIPTKTAQNGLNFVTHEEELNLVKKEQPEEILNIFRFIYLLLGLNYQEHSPSTLIEHLFTKVFPTMKIDSLRTLFLSYLLNNLNINDKQYERITVLIASAPKLLSSSDLLKINRSISYMTFILKEIYDYLNLKTIDGVMIFNLRKAKSKLHEIEVKLKKIKNS